MNRRRWTFEGEASDAHLVSLYGSGMRRAEADALHAELRRRGIVPLPQEGQTNSWGVTITPL